MLLAVPLSARCRTAASLPGRQHSETRMRFCQNVGDIRRWLLLDQSTISRVASSCNRPR